MSEPEGQPLAPVILYDTFAAAKRPLETLEPGRVGIYCCGPTVYDLSHIGHARAALVPDLLVRYLRWRGLEVRYIRNVTDVDDKIIRRANEQGVDPGEVSETYTAAYREDMLALGMTEPTVEPKVTEHIEEIIALVSRLVERGLAYPAHGDVYYRVERFGAYGGLSKRKLEDMQAGARVDVDDRKQHPMDFALWKAAKPGEPSWPSPWGEGRPGWHIECSAMSEKQLGPDFDIHCGGRDLIFPHHENEIAQSQGANGEGSYARYWVHNGFVNFAGEKMSKSLGNFFTIREVAALYHPEVIRYFLMGVHYRSPVNFDVEVRCPACGSAMDEPAQAAGQCGACGAQASAEQLRRQVRFPGLEEADDRVAYVYETLAGARAFLADAKAFPESGELAASVAGMRDAVAAALHDDLNSAAALSELSAPLAEANRLLQSAKGVPKDQRWRTLRRFVDAMGEVADMLGLFARDPEGYLAARRDLKAARVGLDVARVDTLVAERLAARAEKDWARADALRDELSALGVSLRDGAGATSWTI